MLTFEVTGGRIWAIYPCSKRESLQACLTKGSYDGYNTRWRGLESYLYKPHTWGMRAIVVGRTDNGKTPFHFISFDPRYLSQ